MESGVRNVQEDDYKGYKITVVTGYDIRSDKWPIHVYIQQAGKPAEKVVGHWFLDSQTEAFDAGFEIGTEEVDQMSS